VLKDRQESREVKSLDKIKEKCLKSALTRAVIKMAVNGRCIRAFRGG